MSYYDINHIRTELATQRMKAPIIPAQVFLGEIEGANNRPPKKLPKKSPPLSDCQARLNTTIISLGLN